MKQPSHIVVRLGEDFNWWLAPTADQPPFAKFVHGVLDPCQVRALREQLEKYAAYGLERDWLRRAFHFYAVDVELDDGLLQLRAVGDDAEAFALPAIDEDGDGPYFDFLDALGAAHIERLNAEHYRCTLDEMLDELEAIDRDRYFSAETMHIFEEIFEILRWRPAEWDEP
ncbi:MAG: hypothetical protein N3B01_08710 [Verrucomicrobiae bacterium]|nr:hypothetical protein [Verrucomicrobiae bacterium]